MKLKMIVLILAALALPGTLLIPSIIKSTVDKVEVTVVKESKFVDQVTASGSIESLEESELYLDATVVADQVYVEIGDYVDKGQIIADVDINKSKAVMDLNSFNSIAEQTEIPQELVDTLQVFGALSGLSEEDITQAFSTMQSNNNILSSQIEIPTQIVAPMSGVIGDLQLKEGMPTHAGEAVISVVNQTNLALRVAVNESQIQKISRDDKAYITGSGFDGKYYTGTVLKIFPTAKKSTSSLGTESTVDVLIKIDDPDEDLMTGFSAKAQIVTDIQEHILTVPYEAVGQDENNKEYVYLYEHGKAFKRYIETGEEMQSGIEVTSGLGLGDVLIKDNSVIDKNGQYVLIA